MGRRGTRCPIHWLPPKLLGKRVLPGQPNGSLTYGPTMQPQEPFTCHLMPLMRAGQEKGQETRPGTRGLLSLPALQCLIL